MKTFILKKLDFIRCYYKKNIIGIIKYYLKNIFNIKNIIHLHKKLIKNNNALPMFYGLNIFKLNNKDLVSLKNLIPFNFNNSNTLHEGILSPFNGGSNHIIYYTKGHICELNYNTLCEQPLKNINNNPILFPLGTLFFHLHFIKENFKNRVSSVGK